MSKNILIVEDEETLRESVKRIFTKEGYAVEAVESAEQGLALLEANLFDVIISDIILPGMDGMDVARAIRRSKTGNPNTPILMLTARVEEIDGETRILRPGGTLRFVKASTRGGGALAAEFERRIAADALASSGR